MESASERAQAESIINLPSFNPVPGQHITPVFNPTTENGWCRKATRSASKCPTLYSLQSASSVLLLVLLLLLVFSSPHGLRPFPRHRLRLPLHRPGDRHDLRHPARLALPPQRRECTGRRHCDLPKLRARIFADREDLPALRSANKRWLVRPAVFESFDKPLASMFASVRG